MTLAIETTIDLSSFDAMLLAAEDHVIEELGGALTACAALVAATAKGTSKFNDRDGHLRRSIRGGEPYYSAQGGLGIDVIAGSSEVFYGVYLEFGTKTIAPMRFMRDALAEHERDIGTILGAAVSKAFQQAVAT